MRSVDGISRVNWLKRKVRAIPDATEIENIWVFLGWSHDLDLAVEEAAQRNLDLGPVLALAPDFRDVISIVVAGAYGFPYSPASFDWGDILSGKVSDFPGNNPKERILSVLECTCNRKYDS